MANSYTHTYIQFIFTVKGRNNFLRPIHNVKLHNFMKSMVERRDSILIAVNNTQDHLHMLVRLTPTYSISRFMQEIKSTSSKFINGKRWIRGKFEWQRGYAAFSYSRSQVDNVVKYIENQEIHHQKHSFKDEYYELLNIFQVDYDEKYLFDFYD